MNPATDKNTPENELTKTLRRQADNFAASGGGTLDFTQVVSRAGEIRRGRRMRASMVMAAVVVVAVAVPIGITVAAGEPKREAPPATKPDGSAIALNEMPSGKAPQDGYLLDGVLYRGKTSQTLGPGGDPFEIARINGGFLVGRSNPNGSSSASVVSDDGTGTGTTWTYDGGFAVSPGGNVAAFVEPDGTVMTVQDGGKEYFEVGQLEKLPPGSYSARAVVGENCTGDFTKTDCTVYVQSSSENPQIFKVSPHQSTAVVETPILGLDSVRTTGTTTLLAGLISVDETEPGSCSEVSANGKQVWSTCKYSLGEFSPDGRYILAGPAYRDGPGDGSLSILDAANGNVVLDLGTTHASLVTDVRWEDDTHVVASVLDGDKAALVRFEINGHREYATKKVSGTEPYVSPFKLG